MGLSNPMDFRIPKKFHAGDVSLTIIGEDVYLGVCINSLKLANFSNNSSLILLAISLNKCWVTIFFVPPHLSEQQCVTLL